MKEVRLDEKLYKKALESAKSQGYESVDEYVAEVVRLRFEEEDSPLPEWMMKEVAKGIADIDAGRVMSSADVDKMLSSVEEKWVEQNPDR